MAKKPKQGDFLVQLSKGGTPSSGQTPFSSWREPVATGRAPKGPQLDFSKPTPKAASLAPLPQTYTGRLDIGRLRKRLERRGKKG